MKNVHEFIRYLAMRHNFLCSPQWRGYVRGELDTVIREPRKQDHNIVLFRGVLYGPITAEEHDDHEADDFSAADLAAADATIGTKSAREDDDPRHVSLALRTFKQQDAVQRDASVSPWTLPTTDWDLYGTSPPEIVDRQSVQTDNSEEAPSVPETTFGFWNVPEKVNHQEMNMNQNEWLQMNDPHTQELDFYRASFCTSKHVPSFCDEGTSVDSTLTLSDPFFGAEESFTAEEDGDVDMMLEFA